MKLLQDRIKEHLEKAHERHERHYNLRATPRTFHVGQGVFRRNFILSDKSKKICKKFCKNFVKVRIKKVLGFNRYETEKLDGVYHGKDIMIR